MFTIDASVHINAMHSSEEGSDESAAFLKRLHGEPWPVFSPTLLLPEVSAAIVRRTGSNERALAMMNAIRGLRGQVWVALDESLAVEAARFAAEFQLRGADAVYAAVASGHQSILVTRDHQQLERLSTALTVLTPGQASAHLDRGSLSCE